MTTEHPPVDRPPSQDLGQGGEKPPVCPADGGLSPFSPDGIEPPPSDDEIIRRLQGHLKPHVLDDVTLPAWTQQASLFLGGLWLVVQALVVAGIWGVMAWLPLTVLAQYPVLLLRPVILWTTIDPQFMYELSFTLLLGGGYLWVLWKVLRAASRQEGAAVEDVVLSRAGGCSSYRNFLLILWRVLLIPGVAGFSHFSPKGRPSATFDPLATTARLCFLFDRAPHPLSLEGIWKSFEARFPGVFAEPEAGKIFLAGVLRNLHREGLLVDRRDDGLSLHKSIIYGPSPRLRALLDKCRRQPSPGAMAEVGPVSPPPHREEPPSEGESPP